MARVIRVWGAQVRRLFSTDAEQRIKVIEIFVVKLSLSPFVPTLFATTGCFS